MNKQQLIESMRSERAQLDTIIDTRGELEMVRPTLEGGRSIKDALAHIASWEHRFIRAFDEAERGEKPEWPERGWTLAGVDELNARDFEANRQRALGDVVAESRRSYAELLTIVERLSDDDLTLRDRWAWTRGNPLMAFVSDNADAHYREHADAIDAWWTRQEA